MPRFFFHLREGRRRRKDEEGRDLPDAETARKVAVMSARSIICDEVLQGQVPLNEVIEVEDEAGRPLLALPFSDALVIRR